MMVNLAHFGWTSLANQRLMMMKTSVPRVPIGTSRSAVGEVKLAKNTQRDGPDITAVEECRIVEHLGEPNL